MTAHRDDPIDAILRALEDQAWDEGEQLRAQWISLVRDKLDALDWKDATRERAPAHVSVLIYTELHGVEIGVRWTAEDRFHVKGGGARYRVLYWRELCDPPTMPSTS